jgi:glutamyl-Q tRNA(Asp) synthetase
MSDVRRFAPSPSGRLHLGHALSAALNAELVRRSGGRLMLRIEDIDPGRSRAAFTAAIGDDLAWLGVRWNDEYRQSARIAVHRSALMGLAAQGLAYPCFCSRAEVRQAAAARGPAWPRDPDGSPLYAGTCRTLTADAAAARIAAGERPLWRLDTAAAQALAGSLAWRECGPALPDFTPDLSGRTPPPDFAVLRDPDAPVRDVPADPAAWGDVVLGRREVPTSYHLAVVLDDAAAGVSEVVRGRDLYAATAIHRLLQVVLGLPAPRYRHHPLVLDAAGSKLSKSADAASLATLRAAGVTPEAVLRALGLMEP